MTAVCGYSTRELQAAATALAAGQFAENGMVRRRRRAATWQPHCPTVRVLPAHAGAGASTIALALADAAAQSAAVRLVDAATPDWSGLVGASRDRARRRPRMAPRPPKPPTGDRPARPAGGDPRGGAGAAGSRRPGRADRAGRRLDPP